jgi:hypothetical protein
VPRTSGRSFQIFPADEFVGRERLVGSLADDRQPRLVEICELPVGVEADDPVRHTVEEPFDVSRLAAASILRHRGFSINANLGGLYAKAHRSPGCRVPSLSLP